MNKFKIISSLALYAAIISPTVANASATLLTAKEDSTYSITNDDFDISVDGNVLTLKFKNSSLHNNINNIRLVDQSKNRSFTFNKYLSEFKLNLDNQLTDNVYSLVFNVKTSESSSSKELYCPLYIDFPELSDQNVSITSLNPLISLSNINGTYKLNARFNLLNIDSKITNGRIIDENNIQIGVLENPENPRNFVFNLGSSSLESGKLYFIEYTLTNSSNKSDKIKIPFAYDANSIQISPISTNSFTYTSTVNSDNTLNLTLNFPNINPYNITFIDGDNPGFQFLPEYGSNGDIILKNISQNKVIQVEIREGNRILNLAFKPSTTPINNKTPIPFIKFINASSLILKMGTPIEIPLIKSDLLDSGFSTPNTYIKLVSFDDFGNEYDLTSEKRISSSSLKAELIPNMNISKLKKDDEIFVKIFSPTKSIMFPFKVLNTSTSTNPLGFDIIKNSSSNNSISLTFNANSSVLSPTEKFSSNDILIINGEIKGTISNDGRGFNVNIHKDKLREGTNTYTFVKNSNSIDSLSFSGEFYVDKSSSKITLTPLVQELKVVTNTPEKIVLNLDIDDSALQFNSYNSVKLTDEFSKEIPIKTSIKQLNGNRFLEIIIEPASKLVLGKLYNLSVNTGLRNFDVNFIYNNKNSYNPNFILEFNSPSSFTLKNLSSLPGFSIHDFNIKIYDYYNTSDVLYENFSESYKGENLKNDSITRELKSGKTFIDGNRYSIEIKNISTGEIFRQVFVFSDSNIPSNVPSSNIIPSNSINYLVDSISFPFSQGKQIRDVTSGNSYLKAYYKDGRIYVEGLVPNKLYRDLFITVNFSDGTSRTVRLDDFTTRSSTDNLKNYIARVYVTTLTPFNDISNKYRVRYADEEGFYYWYNQLSSRAISGPEFIFRILDANEFNSVHISSQDKIRALYPVVVGRDGDSVGINFWIDEYNNALKNLNSQDLALKTTLTKMLNEEEPKRLFSNLGIRLQ